MPQTLTEWVTLGGVIVGAANFVMLLVVKNAVLGSEIRLMKWAEERFVQKEVLRQITSCLRTDCTERIRERAAGD